jgi:adenosylhomocysteine nucleosidase
MKMKNYNIQRRGVLIMKCIGIIGAMEQEVAKIKEKMQDVTITSRARMDFYEGTLEGKKVVVVRSGIGKVNAGMCTQILADVFGVEAVINTGIAGSLKAEINIADIVISSDVLHHDMDATGFGYPLGQIPRMEVLSFEADKKLIELADKACKKVLPEIGTHIGRIVSGDQFISDKTVKERISSNFDGYCTEMEGAAIAQAAYLNKVPFVILRAISDKADDSATMDYPTFEKQAIANSVKLIKELVATI